MHNACELQFECMSSLCLTPTERSIRAVNGKAARYVGQPTPQATHVQLDAWFESWLRNACSTGGSIVPIVPSFVSFNEAYCAARVELLKSADASWPPAHQPGCMPPNGFRPCFLSVGNEAFGLGGQGLVLHGVAHFIDTDATWSAIRVAIKVSYYCSIINICACCCVASGLASVARL